MKEHEMNERGLGREALFAQHEQMQEEGGTDHGDRRMSRRKLLGTIGMGAIAAAGAAMLGHPLIAEASGSSVVETTIADLRGDNAGAADIYYVLDAGQEGEFYHDSPDSTSVDNTGTVLVSVSGKRYKRKTGEASNAVYNVRWFGAKGDGTADDSDAFQAAIGVVEAINTGGGAGGTVYVPPGTYKVSNLQVKRHYVHIVGDGYGGSILLNKHATNPVIKLSPDTDMATLSHFELHDLMIKSGISRPGDYPLIDGTKIVLSRFVNVVMLNANAYDSGSAYSGSGIKLLNSFQIQFHRCEFRSFYKGYAVNMPAESLNIGNLHFLDCTFMNCAHGVLLGLGTSSMLNSTLFTGCKFLSNQGGRYVVDNYVRYAQSTAVSFPAANQVTVASGTNFEANTVVLLGSGPRMKPAYITGVSGATLTLDRNVTITAGDSVIQGAVAIVSGWCTQEVHVSVGHFEGYDAAVLSSNPYGLISIDTSVINNCSNGLLIDDQVQSVVMTNTRVFASDASHANPNWCVVRITKLSDDNNMILLDYNEIDYAPGSPYVDFTGLEVANTSGKNPKVRILNRKEGVRHMGAFHHAISGDLSVAGTLAVGNAYNGSHLVMGTYHLWVNGGKLYIKNGAPTTPTDGTVVGP